MFTTNPAIIRVGSRIRKATAAGQTPGLNDSRQLELPQPDPTLAPPNILRMPGHAPEFSMLPFASLEVEDTPPAEVAKRQKLMQTEVGPKLSDSSKLLHEISQLGI